jgi:hypothetical protein
MRQVVLTIRVLGSLLLALLARTAIDGPSAAAGIAEAVTALLLLASVGLWRKGKRLSLDSGPER